MDLYLFIYFYIWTNCYFWKKKNNNNNCLRPHPLSFRFDWRLTNRRSNYSLDRRRNASGFHSVTKPAPSVPNIFESTFVEFRAMWNCITVKTALQRVSSALCLSAGEAPAPVSVCRCRGGGGLRRRQRRRDRGRFQTEKQHSKAFQETIRARAHVNRTQALIC